MDKTPLSSSRRTSQNVTPIEFAQEKKQTSLEYVAKDQKETNNQDLETIRDQKSKRSLNKTF